MKRTTKYVAFDVHQATTVASVRHLQCGFGCTREKHIGFCGPSFGRSLAIQRAALGALDHRVGL